MRESETLTSLLRYLSDECRLSLLLPDDRVVVPGRASSDQMLAQAAAHFCMGASRVVALGPIAALSCGSTPQIDEHLVRERLTSWRKWCDIPGVGHCYGSVRLVAVMAGDRLSDDEIIARSAAIQDDLGEWKDIASTLFATWISSGTKLGVFASLIVLFRESGRADEFAADAIHRSKDFAIWSLCQTMTWAVDLPSGRSWRSRGLPRPSFALDKEWVKVATDDGHTPKA